MNYNDKYKDRNPKDTVKILKQFFKNKGFTIKETKNYKTEIGTWWISLDLYYKNNFIMHSNGKGMTKDFCLASAYAELFERFCNNSNEAYATLSQYDIKQARYKKYHYYLAPDEKEISFKEAINNSSRIKFKIDLMNNKNNDLEEIYKLAFKKIIALPYYNIENQDDYKYLMPEMVQMVTGSDGMAAGNTLEEALVQGISEVYEHIIWSKVYDNNIEMTPELNFNKLKLPYALRKKGINLLKLGYKFKIFDYSYLYNIPVIGLLLINPINYSISLILGASPIFNIALERCFTEIYQGIITQQEHNCIMLPIKNVTDIVKYQYEHFGSLSCRLCYNEKQFYNTKKYNNYNTHVFININQGNISNQKLLNYYQNLAKKLNLNFYYRNFSLLNNFYAIHVFLDNYNIFPYLSYQFMKINEENKNKALLFLKQYIISQNFYLEYNDFSKLRELSIKYKKIFYQNQDFFNLIFDYLYYLPDIFSIYHKEDSYLSILFLALNGYNTHSILNNFIHNKTIHHQLKNKSLSFMSKKFLLLILLSQNQYSKNEIQEIYKNIFNKNQKIIMDQFEVFKEIFLLNTKNNIYYQNYIKKMIE